MFENIRLNQPIKWTKSIDFKRHGQGNYENFLSSKHADIFEGNSYISENYHKIISERQNKLMFWRTYFKNIKVNSVKDLSDFHNIF